MGLERIPSRAGWSGQNSVGRGQDWSKFLWERKTWWEFCQVWATLVSIPLGVGEIGCYRYCQSTDESLQHFHLLAGEDDPAGENDGEQAEDQSTHHVCCDAAEKLNDDAHEERQHDLRQEICAVQDGDVQTHSSLRLVGARRCAHVQGNMGIKWWGNSGFGHVDYCSMAIQTPAYALEHDRNLLMSRFNQVTLAGQEFGSTTGKEDLKGGKKSVWDDVKKLWENHVKVICDHVWKCISTCFVLKMHVNASEHIITNMC